MLERSSRLLMVLFALMILASCSTGASGPTTGSESHFLKMCETNADCGEGLACHCGICTVSCENDGACRSLGDAVCRSGGHFSANCSSSDEAEASVCVAECTETAQCLSHGPRMECLHEGWCRVQPPTKGSDVCFAEVDGVETIRLCSWGCCPNACDEVAGEVFDLTRGCRVQENPYAVACIAPSEPGPTALQGGCYVDPHLRIALLTPRPFELLDTGLVEALEPCSSEVFELVMGEDIPTCPMVGHRGLWQHTVDKDHKYCTRDEECVALMGQDCSSCGCDAVHEDYRSHYTRASLDCTDYQGGICDPGCGFFPMDVALCVDGGCELVWISWDSATWDRQPLNQELTIAFPIGYAGPGLVVDGDSGRFVVEQLHGAHTFRFETGPDAGFEPAVFAALPESFREGQRSMLELTPPLIGAFYFDHTTRQGTVLVGIAGEEVREVLHVEFAERGMIESILNTIEVRP